MTKRLYRSRTNRRLAGVCGGLSESFGIDAKLVRILFVLFAVLDGSGLILYIILALIILEEP